MAVAVAVVVVVVTRPIVLVGVVDGVQMKTFPIIAVRRVSKRDREAEKRRQRKQSDQKKAKENQWQTNN